MKNYFAGWCLLVLFLILLVYGLGTYVAMLLWNWIMPLFWHTAPQLTYFQTLGAFLLMHLILMPIKFKFEKK